MQSLRGRKWWEKWNFQDIIRKTRQQIVHDGGQGCESLGGRVSIVEMLTETPGKITSETSFWWKYHLFCLYKPHRGEWVKLWQSSNLVCHQKTCVREKHCQCKECGKVLARAELGAHTQERPWVCSECKKGFISGSCPTPGRGCIIALTMTNLTCTTQIVHQRIHTYMKSKCCQWQKLQRDQHPHHPQVATLRRNPHRCGECGKSFR